MFKKFLLIAAIVFPMLASAQTTKLAVVDTQTILMAMPETTQAQNKIQETSKKLDETYQQLLAEFQRIADEVQKMDDKELPAIRERKVSEFQTSQGKVRKFEDDAARDLQNLQTQLMEPIIQKVRNAIESVGKENGYTMIYDNNPQVILFVGTGAEDITPKVKAKLGI